MRWYWYWTRTDKETRMMLPGKCRKLFDTLEEAIAYGEKEFSGKAFEIEEEQPDKVRTLKLVYVSLASKLIMSDGQFSMWSVDG